MIIPSLKEILFLFMVSGKFVNASYKSTRDIKLTPEDLTYFLNAIDNIVQYTERHKYVLNDLDFFGFFISNANLKTIIRKKDNLFRAPQEISIKIYQISRRLDTLLSYGSTTYHLSSQKAKLISRLFTNIGEWSNQLSSVNVQYSPIPVVEINPQQFEEMYRNYDFYSSSVKDMEKWDPSPEMSDECLVALSLYESKKEKKRLKVCDLPMPCENVLKTGTDFGYALSHRILLLTIARLGMDCYLLGKLQDEDLHMELCQEAYYEGQYIAMNGYDFIDLMMEYVALCSMLGHVEFLRRDWLEETVRLQTTAGCLYNPLLFLNHNETRTENHCDVHMTAVGIAALSCAVKWILENVYAPPKSILYTDSNMLALPFLRRLYATSARHGKDNKWPGQRYLV
ncbi:uncharacterized protein LOC113233214 [Hyposmocoma kahamanoa]|uniref:uncharacterized protein LOC113233214 n=1 Tax=Hyposmocoma kahamanoa TaxID=1477025 RepID=UPI000E6D959D|nr:uncharacterized protein LOC113233214 [Hyposmocoma kahamanoa]